MKSDILATPSLLPKPFHDYESPFQWITSGTDTTKEQLHHLIWRVVRVKLLREYGDSAGDVHHDGFIDIRSAFKSRIIRNIDSLLAFVRTLVHHRRLTLVGQKICQRQGPGGVLEMLCPAQGEDQALQNTELKTTVKKRLGSPPEIRLRGDPEILF